MTWCGLLQFIHVVAVTLCYANGVGSLAAVWTPVHAYSCCHRGVETSRMITIYPWRSMGTATWFGNAIRRHHPSSSSNKAIPLIVDKFRVIIIADYRTTIITPISARLIKVNVGVTFCWNYRFWNGMWINLSGRQLQFVTLFRTWVNWGNNAAMSCSKSFSLSLSQCWPRNWTIPPWFNSAIFCLSSFLWKDTHFETDSSGRSSCKGAIFHRVQPKLLQPPPLDTPHFSAFIMRRGGGKGGAFV